MKVLKTLVVVVSAVLMFAAGPVQAEKLTLRIGTDPSFYPFEFTRPEYSSLVGFDIDIMEAIAKASGFKIKWVLKPFEDLEDNLQKGILDAVISGIVINNERKQVYDFSDTYMNSGRSIMIHKRHLDSIKNESDLEGKRVCYLDNKSPKTRSVSIANANMISCGPIQDCVLKLSKGECEGFVHGFASLSHFLVRNPNPELVVISDFYDLDLSLAIMLKKDVMKTKFLIDDGLKKIKIDGTYKDIYNKWFSRN
ncbi:MAG: transporter substrate-binding domain-containing protein [Succinivibrio sp.]|nr:transporter substrate-binding domain-containing protein [Succinivibrio sp.]